MRVAKSLARLRGCADSPEPSQLTDTINATLSCTGADMFSLVLVYMYLSVCTLLLVQSVCMLLFVEDKICASSVILAPKKHEFLFAHH